MPSHDLFKGHTSQERCETGKTLLAEYPELNEYFDKEWLESLLTAGVETEKVHPLFWHLTNPYTNERLAEAIKLLASNSPSYKKFIQELKNSKTDRELVGHIREVEAYYILSTRGNDVIWKPVIKTAEGTLSPDLLIKWKVPIYVEILAVTESDADTNEQKAQAKVQIGINKIEENIFSISTHYESVLQEEDVEGVVDFVREQIPSLSILEGGTERRILKKNGKDFVKIDFHRIEGLRGWVGGGGPARSVDTSSRIKHKILDKIQAFQLPPKKAGEHINGYLIFLEPILADSFSVVSAVVGQHTLSFPLPIPGESLNPSETAIPGHAPNGVVHHNAWDATIGTNLDFIASTSTRNGEIMGPKSLMMFNEGLQVNPQELRNVFFDRDPEQERSSDKNSVAEKPLEPES